MTKLDLRTQVVRPDAAAESLRGVVNVPTYLSPTRATICATIAELQGAPSDASERISELLFGEEVDVFEDANGWCWVQCKFDGYVGYIKSSKLMPYIGPPTHTVVTPLALGFSAPDLKSPVSQMLAMGARVREDLSAMNDSKYLRVHDVGWVPREALSRGYLNGSYVDVAEQFLRVPYLWGGKTFVGCDCAGLVQTSMRLFGIQIGRDSDQQINSPLVSRMRYKEESMRRGDLIYIPGHIAIYAGGQNCIHASGIRMSVCIQDLYSIIEERGKRLSSVVVGRLKHKEVLLGG